MLNNVKTCFSATMPHGCIYHVNSEKSPEPSLGGRKGSNTVDSVDTQHCWETRLLCVRFPRIPAQSQPVSPPQVLPQRAPSPGREGWGMESSLPSSDLSESGLCFGFPGQLQGLSHEM